MPARPKVIVVDDDDDQLHLSTRRLDVLGFQPLSASDGLAALQLMARHADCTRIVTDFHMPRLGGADWIRLLERFCSDFRVVVMSGEDVDAGPFLFTPKPVDFRQVAAYLSAEREAFDG